MRRAISIIEFNPNPPIVTLDRASVRHQFKRVTQLDERRTGFCILFEKAIRTILVGIASRILHRQNALGIFINLCHDRLKRLLFHSR